MNTLLDVAFSAPLSLHIPQEHPPLDAAHPSLWGEHFLISRDSALISQKCRRHLEGDRCFSKTDDRNIGCSGRVLWEGTLQDGSRITSGVLWPDFWIPLSFEFWSPLVIWPLSFQFQNSSKKISRSSPLDMSAIEQDAHQILSKRLQKHIINIGDSIDDIKSTVDSILTKSGYPKTLFVPLQLSTQPYIFFKTTSSSFVKPIFTVPITTELASTLLAIILLALLYSILRDVPFSRATQAILFQSSSKSWMLSLYLFCGKFVNMNDCTTANFHENWVNLGWANATCSSGTVEQSRTWRQSALINELSDPGMR